MVKALTSNKITINKMKEEKQLEDCIEVDTNDIKTIIRLLEAETPHKRIVNYIQEYVYNKKYINN